MADEERQKREALFVEISDAVQRAVSAFSDASIVPPEGFQSLLSGLTQVWGRKSTPGIMIHAEEDGLFVDVSVSVTSARTLAKTGRELQQAVWDALRPLEAPVRAVNIDILKIVK